MPKGVSTIVHVTWRDASSDAEGWTHLNDIDRESTLVDSVGVMLDKDEARPDHVSIYQSRIQGTDQVDSVLHIPKAMVVLCEIIHIKAPQPKPVNTVKQPSVVDVALDC